MNRIIKINVLAANIENAKELVEAAEGNIYIGVLVKNFSSIDIAVNEVNKLQNLKIPVSVGLGAGDPTQWEKVVAVATKTKPAHVNQVFPAAGYTISALKAVHSEATLVNALVQPGGIPGKVSMLTGPISKNFKEFISCEAVAALFQESHIKSVKFYPIGGDKHLDEVAAMVKASVAAGIKIFEPTGGITLDSVESVVKTCLENGAEIVIPHIYTAMVDKKTGLTDPQVVKKLLTRLHAI
ncbi:2-dehydro-3-deoxy-phosphogluconate aldolase [Propionispira arboris]|uniref:2-dehydro-3-deoxy-phosphogluconate aldolase n=1 Tax=Propionispira arboris TaxID=84035 RepID=A0A1H7C602_9FIRM|nr:KDGP aldolase [Propionispira arboris]SEJ84704.1 2-dehydro-3-deoxy-phosphogluconate aldolase [Propionispira arboris]